MRDSEGKTHTNSEPHLEHGGSGGLKRTNRMGFYEKKNLQAKDQKVEKGLLVFMEKCEKYTAEK